MPKDTPVETYLRRLVRSGTAGERLPTVRQLMHQFGVSQLIVQRAIRRLDRDGLVIAQVGRGTFIADGDANAVTATPRNQAASVLMLTRNVGSARTSLVSSQLQSRLAERGINSIQVVYSDVDHALQAQRDLPKFTACILQSHFDLVPIDLLAFMRRRATAILIDGATITGIDVDSVASDWRSAVEVGLDHLMAQGHRTIAFATSSFKARPIDATHRHFESLRHFSGGSCTLAPPILLDHLPGEERAEHIAEQLARHLNSNGRFDFSALMIWGITRGAELQAAFERLAIRIPDDLSVIVLGHVDVEAEHRNFFTMAGSSAQETVERIIKRIERRRRVPTAGYEPDYLPAHLISRASVVQYNI